MRTARRILLLVALAALGLGGWEAVRLDREVAARLGDDGARAHTRFFAAPFRILAGMDLERAHVFDRLREVGYHDDPTLASPGTWRRRRGRLELRVPAIDDVARPLPERSVRIDLDGTIARGTRGSRSRRRSST